MEKLKEWIGHWWKLRAKLSDSKVPKKFWVEDSTAAYVRNRNPTIAVERMAPCESWKGYKPGVSNFRIFGYGAYVHIPKDERFKIDPKVKSIILGYGIGVKGYWLYDTKTSRVFSGWDMIFNESASISQLGKEKFIRRTLVEVECLDICDDKSQEITKPRRSPRITRTPHRYDEWDYIAHNLSDLLTIDETLSRTEKKQWRVKSIPSILIKYGILLNHPVNVKDIGSKWVFKRKYDANGNGTTQTLIGCSGFSSEIWSWL